MADPSPNSGHNGATSASAPWEPETPFLNAPYVSQAPRVGGNPGQPLPRRSTIESPFSAEYAGEDSATAPQAEAFATLIGELHDEEFIEAMEDLVNDAGAVLEEEFSSEIGDPAHERFAMERRLSDYFAPLEEATEGMLDRMISELGEKDLSGLSETELDTLLEGYALADTELPPAFENFGLGFLKKAKNAVKGAVKAAKKVAGAIAFPHRLILNRLKGLVRPLIQRVLKFAINKLPVAVRPLAGQLAQRFLGTKASPEKPTTTPKNDGSGADEGVEASAADPALIAEELDTTLAGYLLAGEEFDSHTAAEEFAAERDAAGAPMQALDRARRDFAEAIVQQEEGEDPSPAIEQYAQAILAALRLGIKVVGRPRVVKFLSGLVAKLINKFVGQQQSGVLSRALVDTGLRLVSLEAAVEEPKAAGDALAATVEDTLTRLVQSAPAAAWESEALLEAYAQEAFQEAASAHFPDSLIRADLHEASSTSGAWIALPANTPKKRYKKYSRVLDVSIAPQAAAALKTFSGISLSSFLKDRLGVSSDQPVRARVHLYEAIPGTRLSYIALHERGVTGLGSARRLSWSLFHPLTPEAAGLLLNEPGLGRAVPPSFLAKRRKTAIGQRFYYLEIPGARVRFARRAEGRSARPVRSSQTRVVLDFVKRQLRVALYYGEADAQDLAKQLRQKLPHALLIKGLKARHDVQLKQILSGEASGAVRIVHEAAPTEETGGAMIGAILRVAGRQLWESMRAWILDALKKELETRYDRFAGEFDRAAQADQDGVTLILQFDVPTLIEQLRRLFRPGGILAAPAAIAALGRQTIAGIRIEPRPGFAQV